jgi:hypothetical protein
VQDLIQIWMEVSETVSFLIVSVRQSEKNELRDLVMLTVYLQLKVTDELSSYAKLGHDHCV